MWYTRISKPGSPIPRWSYTMPVTVRGSTVAAAWITIALAAYRSSVTSAGPLNVPVSRPVLPASSSRPVGSIDAPSRGSVVMPPGHRVGRPWAVGVVVHIGPAVEPAWVVVASAPVAGEEVAAEPAAGEPGPAWVQDPRSSTPPAWRRRRRSARHPPRHR